MLCIHVWLLIKTAFLCIKTKLMGVKEKSAYSAIGLSISIPNNAVSWPLKFCISYCFQMLLGGVPGACENNNNLCNIWGGKQSVLWGIRKLSIARNRGHFAPTFIGQRSILYCSRIKTKWRPGRRGDQGRDKFHIKY